MKAHFKITILATLLLFATVALSAAVASQVEPSHNDLLTTSNVHHNKPLNDRTLDAPKLYHLNALLYKKRPADEASPIESPQSAALPDDKDDSGPMRPHGNSKQTPYLKPKGMMHVAGDGSASDGARADAADEDMSIDSLIRAMKRRPAKEMAELSPDDEATIQRKSTGSPEDSAPSRLRAKSIPRRKRRASTRQAPPKLKSRRVSRNSRRRKLRHGIKPKRRA